MFAKKLKQARREATTPFMNLKMNLNDHIIKVIGHLNEAEINGA